MKVDGSDWKDKAEDKSESEQLFDRLLFYRQTGLLFAERFRLTKELERLLSEDQGKFAEYLSDTIHLYETECEFSLDDVSGIHYDSDIDPPAYVDDEGLIVDSNDFYYDKNTTVVQYLHAKRVLIITYLHDIKKLWNNKKVEEIAAKLKDTHSKDVSEITNTKTKIKNDFSLLENLTMQAIEDSSDVQKNEALKKSLEEMRNDLKNRGFDV